MYCIQCGKQLVGSGNFCGNCGAKQTIEKKETAVPNKEQFEAHEPECPSPDPKPAQQIQRPDLKQMYNAYLGEKGQSYYLEKFRIIDFNASMTGGGWRWNEFGWNWSAFFFGNLWFLYRKMYGVFLIVGTISILLSFLTSNLISGVLYLLLSFFLAAYAIPIYHRKVKRDIEKAQFVEADKISLLRYLKSAGGVNHWVIGVVLFTIILGIVLAIAIPQFAK